MLTTGQLGGAASAPLPVRGGNGVPRFSSPMKRESVAADAGDGRAPEKPSEREKRDAGKNAETEDRLNGTKAPGMVS